MLIKKTGNDKIDFAKRRGYEVGGHYFDGKDSFVLWKKKFWRNKPSEKQYQKVLNNLEKQVREVKQLQRKINEK
jgi:hypothetical protein